MKHKKNQRGSALVYILIAIALLAALTASFMDSSSQQTNSQNAANLTAELNSQINLIRSAIEECVLLYPAGDSTMAVGAVGGHTPLWPYPLMANNTWLPSPTPSSSLVANIGCPGNPGNSNNHTKIFGGSSGKFLPPPPKPMGSWSYMNDSDGVFIVAATTATDAYIDTALQKLDSMYSKCELQYVNNTDGSSTIELSAIASRAPCTAGKKCIVVKLKTTGTTVYPGETGCP